MVQALAFAELLAGGILFLAGLSGHSPAEILKGESKPWLGLKGGNPQEAQNEVLGEAGGLANEATEGLKGFLGSESVGSAPLPSKSGSAYEIDKKELEKSLKKKLSKTEESELQKVISEKQGYPVK